MESRQVLRVCEFCGKEFFIFKAWLRKGIAGKYCSYKCSGKAKSKPPVVNKCCQCGKMFISKKYHRLVAKFCSRLCSAKNHRTGKYVKCIVCEKEFYLAKQRGLNKTKGKYCSRVCQLKDWNEKSLKNEAPCNYRERAWKIFEKKCYDCGYKEHPEILLVHHIDGNRDNGKNENLIPVCQNCHCLRHLKLGGRMPPSVRN